MIKQPLRFTIALFFLLWNIFMIWASINLSDEPPTKFKFFSWIFISIVAIYHMACSTNESTWWDESDKSGK